MSQAIKTDAYYFFLSRHHRKIRDELNARIRALSEDDEDYDLIASYCVALITTAVSYMECRINEFWLGVLNDGIDSQGLTAHQKKQFKEMATRVDWKWENILDKYQLALKILGLPVFDKGRHPFQAADSLVLLRNEVVHNVPWGIELLEGKRISKQSKLEARLQRLIGKCPYEGLKIYFPENCLHQDCAEWASTTSQEFVDKFLLRAGANTKVYVSGGIFRM
ncbi:MAG: hypothetical protein ABIN99_01950 [Nitrosospira sp.]